MTSRLPCFMNDNNLFSLFQHGYLKGRSTNIAIYQFFDSILNCLEEKNFALSLFINLKKAFDCVDHDLLLFKLDQCDIRVKANDWIRSYLLKRKQHVVVSDDKSDIVCVDIGIGQGTIAGPILFLVYIN